MTTGTLDRIMRRILDLEPPEEACEFPSLREILREMQEWVRELPARCRRRAANREWRLEMWAQMLFLAEFWMMFALPMLGVQLACHLWTQLEIRELLGFDCDVVTVNGQERLVVTEVRRSGTMYESGLREGDRLLVPGIDDLYYPLAMGQGTRVSLPVVRRGSVRTVTLDVPDLDLLIDPGLLIWRNSRAIGRPSTASAPRRQPLTGG